MRSVLAGGVDLGSLTGDELSARICALDAERNRVEVLLAEAIAVWDARREWAADGAVSASSWLAWQCEMGRGEARQRVRTARRLRSMPLTHEAARAGLLGIAKVVLLAGAAGRSEASKKAFERDEALLVHHAERLSVEQLAVLLREWLARVDAAAGGDDDDARHQRRRLHLSELLDGMWRIDGLLEDDLGRWLHGELERRSAEIKARDTRDGMAPSTPAQRRADALGDLCRGDRPATADITIVITADDLAQGRHDEHACDAVIRRVVMQESEILDLGRSQRLISAAQRRALSVRDRGCVFPGCDRPPDQCAGHHIVHWPRGGLTDMANLVFLCAAHHHAVHKRRFGLARTPDGELTVTRPDGTRIS